MGFTQIPNRIIRSRELSSKAKNILNIIFSYHPCFPSYTYLEEITGMSRPTISSAIKELVEKKIIEYQKGSAKSHMSNEYQILPENDWAISLEASKKIKPDLVKNFNQPSKNSLLPLVKNFNSNNTNTKNTNKNKDFSNLTIGREITRREKTVINGFNPINQFSSYSEDPRSPEGGKRIRILMEQFGFNKKME